MMDKQPYRPCPICRTQLEEIPRQNTAGEYADWKYYECKNCGSVIWINPFLGVKTGMVGK